MRTTLKDRTGGRCKMCGLRLYGENPCRCPHQRVLKNYPSIVHGVEECIVVIDERAA